MKLLVTGGQGQLAFECVRLAKQQDYTIFAPSKAEMDITDLVALTHTFAEFKPDVVINTAAYTKVDAAEREPHIAMQVNDQGVLNLSLAMQTYPCKLFHISTDYVFDGSLRRPYVEEDLAHPINQYGLSKLAGEYRLPNHATILRVSGVFGEQGANFVKTILRLAKERDVLKIVMDQITCPTPAKSIAETVFKMIPHNLPGLYHYCGDEPVSWYDFAKRIAKHAGLSNAIIPITAEELALPAKRPNYSVFNCAKIKNTFAIDSPSWEHGLTHVIQAISSA